MKDRIKYYIGRLNQIFWTILFFFMPTQKNTVLFDSFLGKQYSCNPRAIYEKLLAEHPEMHFVWAFHKPEDFAYLKENANTTICRYRSFKHYYYCVCAKTVVFNWKRTYDQPTRKNQIAIQTWHGGGCYKKAGTAIKENTDFHSKVMQKEINTATYYVSSSAYFSKHVIRNQNQYTGKILETGMPRNDRFFYKNTEISNQIRKKLNIPSGIFIILYAPTYRDSIIDQQYDALDYQKLIKSVEKRFDKQCMILYRGHHYTTNSSAHTNTTVLDVTSYPDMQDLLLISDMLISDYSSCIWDYSFTYRPCFLYTPDLEKYIEGRGLDEDIYSWGFPVACSNQELTEKILSFHAVQYHENMDMHHQKLGSFENGTATEKICSLILKNMEE